MRDRKPQDFSHIVAATLQDAVVFSTQIHDEVVALIAKSAASRAIVTVSPNPSTGFVGIKRAEGATITETVAKVGGFMPVVGDTVLVLPVNNQLVVVGSANGAAPISLALDAGLVNPDPGYIVYDPVGQDLCNGTGDVATTASTATYQQAMSTSFTLPAGGTFNVGMWFTLGLTRTPAGQANIRGNINGNLGGARVVNPDIAIYTNHMHWHAAFAVAGGTAMTLKIEYHGHSGAGVTTNAIQPMIWPRIQRVS